MTKRTIVLIGLAVLLGAIYAVYFTDWFAKSSIQIIPTIRPGNPQARVRGEAPVYEVSFQFDGKYRLTRVTVYEADDFKTNKYPAPLWDLMADAASAPTKFLIYGQTPRGMKPAVPRARPQPLQPGVDYMLVLEAGSKIRAQTNFHTREVIKQQGS